MYLIITAIFALFILMIFFTVQNGNKVKNIGLIKTGEVMYSDQKAKVQVASHSMALTVGRAIEKITGHKEKVAIIQSLVDAIRFEDDDSGYYFVYQDTTNVAMPVKKALVGKNLGDLKDKNGVYVIRDLRNRAKEGGGFVEYIWPKPGSEDTPKVSYAEMIPGTDMWIGTGVYVDNIEAFKASLENDINSKVRSNLITMLITAGLIFIGIITLALVIVFGLVRALNEMIDNFKDIAEGEGDLTQRINIKTKDEIAELAKWFNIFLEKLQSIIGKITDNTAAIPILVEQFKTEVMFLPI